MLLKLKADELKIVDDRKKEVKPQVEMEVRRSRRPAREPVGRDQSQPGGPGPRRQEAELAARQGRSHGPGRDQDLQVPEPGPEGRDRQARRRESDPQDTEVDEQVWKVNVTLVYPGEGPAFESYRQGLFNNRLWLQRADGSRFEHNGGFSNTSTDGGKLGFEYLFVDAPGKPADYQLIYETPSKVVTDPAGIRVQGRPVAVRAAPDRQRSIDEWNTARPALGAVRQSRSTGSWERDALNVVRSRPYFWSFWVTLRRDRPLCRAQRATLPLVLGEQSDEVLALDLADQVAGQVGKRAFDVDQRAGARRLRGAAGRPTRAGRRGGAPSRRPGRPPP